MAIKRTFNVAIRDGQDVAIRASTYREAEERAKRLARDRRRWVDIVLDTGEDLAEVSPEGIVNLSFKGCEFA